MLAVISLVGCEYNNQNQPSKHLKGSQVYTICVDSVAYIMVGRGLAAKLHTDGTPYLCVDTDTKIIIR